MHCHERLLVLNLLLLLLLLFVVVVLIHFVVYSLSGESRLETLTVMGTWTECATVIDHVQLSE